MEGRFAGRALHTQGLGRCPHAPWVLVCMTQRSLLPGLGLGQAKAGIRLLKQPCHFESFMGFEQLSLLLFWGPGPRGENICEMPVAPPRAAVWPPQAERVTFLFKACGRCSSAVLGFESPHCGLVLSLPLLPPLPGPALLLGVHGGRYGPNTNLSPRLTHPSADWGGGLTFPPLSSGSPARWREAVWGDEGPVGQGGPCVRTAEAVFNLLADRLPTPSLRNTPSWLWELPAPQPGCDWSRGPGPGVFPAGGGWSQGWGGHTPGQKEPNFSEMPPSPPCLPHVTL